MYASKNFKTKKAFKQEVQEYVEYQAALEKHNGDKAAALKETDWLVPRQPITLYAPGLGSPTLNGTETVEGPHSPAPHTWYATVEVKDGIVVKVK